MEWVRPMNGSRDRVEEPAARNGCGDHIDTDLSVFGSFDCKAHLCEELTRNLPIDLPFSSMAQASSFPARSASQISSSSVW